MDLHDIANEIRDLLENRRTQLNLSFIEEDHIYYMRNTDGNIVSTFPSVSSILKKFYIPFDDHGVSYRMAKGDLLKQQDLLESWKQAATSSSNLGSRVHYELERELVSRYGEYKQLRHPIFQINEEQKIKSDNMIEAGKAFIDTMLERDAVLVDTEIVMGDPIDGYTGQPDKIWIVKTKNTNDFGFVITDYKTNKPKNFESQRYTKKMLKPFEKYDDTALTHYYLQLPLYGRLMLNMLKNTKYSDKKILGGIVVLLKEDKTYQEYRVPSEIINKILTLDLKQYMH